MKRISIFFACLLLPAFLMAQENKLICSVPFKLIDNRPFIEVKIKKRTFHFILDCGAGNALNLATADSLKLELSHPTMQNGAGAKRATFWLATVDTMGIGTESMLHATMQVTDLSEIKTKLNLPYLDGIIGYNFMKRYAVQFDYPRGVINFYKTYVSATGMAFSYYYGQIPKIHVDIDGEPATVIVDTGDRTALTIFSHYADKQGIPANYQLSEPTVTGYGIGGPIKARTFTLKKLKVGERTLKKVASRVPTLTTGGFAVTDIDGSIGGGALKNYKFTIDYPARKLYFE